MSRPRGAFREAARLGLGAELDLLAAQTILESARALPDERTVTVNVSPATILDSRFAVVLAAADRDISIEITEHDRVEDYRALVRALARLPSHSFGVDDVGSGYASMQHILRLEPSYVKLDRALVTAIDHDPSKQALVRGLLGFLAETGTDVVAEGIETGDEARALGDLGVGYGQGYFFGRPAPAAELIST